MSVDVRWVTAFLDTPSREAEPFWVAVTGWPLSARRDGGTFATLTPGGGDACVRVQVLGSGVARAHLDLHVVDVAGAAARVGDVVAEHGDLVVVRSPAGVEFCLVEWRGEGVRPGPARWAGGQSSVLDQVCVDVPAPLFDAEVAFWAGLTGWAARDSDRPEFRWLERPAGVAVRILLQRVGSAAAGVHLDLACDDVDAEVARHVDLGASVVRRVPGEWTTLRDPVGREYCVTARSPW